MGEHFTLQVSYNNKVEYFEGELRQLGYTHKIHIVVHGVDVVFEPDEERNYRVIIEHPENAEKLDKSLLQAIVNELEQALQ